MTSYERDIENYRFFSNRAAKIQEALDAGILNDECKELLTIYLTNDISNAKRIKAELNAYRFDV